MNRKQSFFTGFLLLLCTVFAFRQKEKPVLYIIGDSTVRNGSGAGSGGLWGWGSFLADAFDTTKLAVVNAAIGGRSSRTFLTEGRWDRILATLKKGDFVIMQFGHNDSGPLDDTARARGTLKGIGDEEREIDNPITRQHEVVHTYGWYLRRYIRDAKAKGATAIVCSPIPRNDWKEGKVVRSAGSYSGWAAQVAREEGAFFIDLNNRVAAEYERLGADSVKTFFPGDHTHTAKAGARLNARVVVSALKQLNIPGLKRYFN